MNATNNHVEKSALNLYLALIFFILLPACASEVRPSGGEPDPNPPALVSAEPKHLSTNFEGKTITLHFDKYLQLQNVYQELVVSPPLETQPEIDFLRKRIRIKLQDPLEENTTYSFRFGEALRDFREGNILHDFQYVISTGNYVDSANVSGRIIHAFDNTPAGNVKVMLHRNLEDSAVLKQQPFYYARSDQNGNFSLDYLRPGTYRLYALEDKSNDYLFSDGDKFAFYPDTLNVQDSLTGITLYLYEEPLRKVRLIDWNTIRPGFIKAVFNRHSENLSIKEASSASKKESVLYDWKSGDEEDSLYIWYYPFEGPDTRLFVFDQDEIIDTFDVNHTDFDTIPDGKTFSLSGKAQSGSAIDKDEPLIFNASHPLISSNPDLIHVLEDSIKPIKPEVSFEGTGKNKLSLAFQKKYSKSYVVMIDSAAICNMFEACNDSIYYTYNVRNEEDYGLMEAVVTMDDTSAPALIQLIQNGEVKYQKSVNKPGSVWFYDIKPGHYWLKGVSDMNRDEKWTTGNFMKGRQPERVYFHDEEIHIRANWEFRDIRIHIGE